MGRKKSEDSATINVNEAEAVEVKEKIVEEKIESVKKQTRMEKLLAKAKADRERHKTQKAIVTKFEVPYTLVPNISSPIAGFIKEGTLLYISEEIYDREKGNFWKTEDRRYINKDWDVKEIN